MKILQRWAVCGAVMLVTSVAATEARGAWSAPFTVARSAGETPALAVAPGGDATVAWLDPDPLSMMARRITQQGRLARPRTFTTELGDWPVPKLSVSRSGATVMAWPRFDDARGYEIVVRRMTAAGRLGSLRTIAVERGVLYDSLELQLAVDAAGNATIAWNRVDGHGMEPKGVAIDAATVRLRRYEKDGTLGRVIEIPADDGYDTSPRLAVEPSGAGVIAWLHRSQSGYQVRAALLDRAGALGSAQAVSAPGPSWSGEAAEVAMDRAGRATIVWVQPSEAGQMLAARQLSTLALGPLQILTAPSQPTFMLPRVVASRPGDATVAWISADDSVSASSLQARQLRAGEPGPTQQIAPFASHPGPVLAADARGRTTIVWEHPEGDYPNRRLFVRARVISPYGRLGTIATLNPGQRPTILSGRPTAGVDARGVVTVAWSVQRKLDWAIRAARFTPRRLR